MKHFFPGLLLVLITGMAFSQKNPQKTPGPSLKLKSFKDSLSYAIGMNISDGLGKQKIPALNPSAFRMGMESIFQKKTALVTAQKGNEVTQRFMAITKTKIPMPPANASLPPTAPLKSLHDSASYVIGMNIGRNLVKQHLDNINPSLVGQSMDAFNKKQTTLFTLEYANQVINNKLYPVKSNVQQMPDLKVLVQKAQGKAFLDSIKKKEGVITTASGLCYEVMKRGDSTSARPTTSDKFVANYAGTLIDGTEFDNSYKRGAPLTLGVTQVIRGWTEALQLMHIGDKFKIYLPSDLGYGDTGMGSNIPGGATLIFEMELLGIEK